MDEETAQVRKRTVHVERSIEAEVVRGIASYKRASEICGGHLLLVRGMPVFATDGIKVAKHVTGGVLYHFWMRTMNVSRIPSEWVVQHVLRKTFAELLADASRMPNWVKFIRERMDLKRYRPAA